MMDLIGHDLSMFYPKINGKPQKRCSGMGWEWGKTQDPCLSETITLAGLEETTVDVV